MPPTRTNIKGFEIYEDKSGPLALAPARQQRRAPRDPRAGVLEQVRRRPRPWTPSGATSPTPRVMSSPRPRRTAPQRRRPSARAQEGRVSDGAQEGGLELEERPRFASASGSAPSAATASSCTAGSIIVRQRGMTFKAGENAGLGNDYTVYAKITGRVRFEHETTTRSASGSSRCEPSRSRPRPRTRTHSGDHRRAGPVRTASKEHP